jgi:hypothetical protein
MRFESHFQEQAPPQLRRLIQRLDTKDHQTAIWNAFIESELTGVNDDDCAILPRVLPASYLPVIEKTAREIATFVMRLISLPEREVRAIVPAGPIRDFLLDELEVLRHRPDRLTGSFRFDMAIVGEPTKSNPPKLLEINEIGFDGLARSSFIQKTILSLLPGLNEKVFALDTAANEVKNMMRLGRKIARVQYDSYNWDEEYLLRTGMRLGADLKLVSPSQLRCDVDPEESPFLTKEPFSVRSGRVFIGKDSKPDAVQMSFAFELDDYQHGRKLYKELVRAKTPQYGPFITGLAAAKTILILLNDPALRKRLLGSSKKLEDAILPAFSLKGRIDEVKKHSNYLVIKHTDGFGGQQVFMGAELTRRLKRIRESEHHEWVVQKRTHLNTLQVHGILSRPRRVISDLGVFVQYDWSRGKFDHFKVGGFITRATNKSFKVNVSGGGIQVPVMFARGI